MASSSFDGVDSPDLYHARAPSQRVSARNRQITSLLMQRALDVAILSSHYVPHELLHRENALPGEWEYLSRFRARDAAATPLEIHCSIFTSPFVGAGS
jgi:hypothetical protein